MIGRQEKICVTKKCNNLNFDLSIFTIKFVLLILTLICLMTGGQKKNLSNKKNAVSWVRDNGDEYTT